MGTDINAMLEASDSQGYWQSLGEIRIDRNGALFQKMQDISEREPRFEENPSNYNAYLNKTCSQAFSKWYEEELSIYTSWVTLRELHEMQTELHDKCEAIAESYGYSPDSTRLVFFLSN